MFNRKMRLEAIEKGYHLSDKGMYKFRKNADKSEEKGADIKCKTER
jgi:DNA polymerase/3'-5' exonuclease PolX